MVVGNAARTSSSNCIGVACPAIDIDDIVNEDASLISRRAWSDRTIYELEKRAIFAKSWLFLAHESQIPNPGDFVQAYMCETPIIVSRGPEGGVHALVNSCTHRGLPVCRWASGNTKKFVCPYHNWNFDVTGKLQAIPGIPGSACRSAASRIEAL